MRPRSWTRSVIPRRDSASSSKAQACPSPARRFCLPRLHGRRRETPASCSSSRSASSGPVVGSDISYYLGHRGGRPFVERFGHLFRIRPEHITGAELFFARHGDKAVLATSEERR